MEGIPAPDVADYKRRKEIELGLNPGTITQPQAKRPKIETRVFTQEELRIQLEAHKALMGAGDNPPPSAPEAASGPVVNAAPETYAAPPTQAPILPPPNIMPPFPPPMAGQASFPPPPFPGAAGFPAGYVFLSWDYAVFTYLFLLFYLLGPLLQAFPAFLLAWRLLLANLLSLHQAWEVHHLSLHMECLPLASRHRHPQWLEHLRT